MAPPRARKRHSSTDSDTQTRSHLVTVKSPIRTPIQSPRKRVFGITEAQKQALIDNLQLEVTERARKLRAQYALQAQSLRTRIELRINRIPTSLRNANMGELEQRYRETIEEKGKAAPTKMKSVAVTGQPVMSEKQPQAVKPSEPIVAPKSRGLKRTSDVMESTDKENASAPAHDIPNPKKRTKLAGPSRQFTNPSTVLSPKSANSRTLPQSPSRPTLTSPQKSYLTHPASPLKHFSPIKAVAMSQSKAAAATSSLSSMLGEKAKPGRTKIGTSRKASNTTTTKPANTRAKRGAALTQESEDVRKASNTSNISSISNETTVINNTKKAPTAVSKKKNVGVQAVGKKVAEAPAPTRRVLRKRA